MPSGPTPAAPRETLYLSNLDDVVGARVFTPTVYFFASDDQKPVMKTRQDALASVLVPFYPFSALMVQAHCERSLVDLKDLKVPNASWTPLIFRFPHEEPYKVLDMPLLIAQVTLFRCVGLGLGLRICHCIVDGIGAVQFLSSWAATAKAGTLISNPASCWDREIFQPRNPPLVKFPHIEYMRIDDGPNLTMSLWQTKALQRCYRISREFQTWLKTSAQRNDDMSSTCSTFDAIAAHIWRSWVKALDVKPLNYELRLTFSVNARKKLKNLPVKEGCYGNVVCLACVTSTVRKLVYGRLLDTTRLVHEARPGISKEYLRSTVDYVEGDRPTRLEFVGKLTITQWTRFSIYDC
ncbi:hypothetical protein ACFX2K_017911 [Malus domestica]